MDEYLFVRSCFLAGRSDLVKVIDVVHFSGLGMFAAVGQLHGWRLPSPSAGVCSLHRSCILGCRQLLPADSID